MIELTAVGGYSEVGRNMTAVKYRDEAVILDMGIHLEKFIDFKGEDEFEFFNVKELIQAGAVPEDSSIKDWKKKVIAIIPSHGHLDHIGAIPYMAQKYDCPIICTPYTASVIKAILKDKKLKIPNEIIVLETNQKMKLSDSISIELINMTHSIPDTATVVIYTPSGQVVYANDFKLDNTPVIGEKPNYNRLRQLGNEGKVKVLILDSLYADLYRKTPSEAVAKQMLEDVLLEVDSEGKAVIVTTFSSHIARLKSIVECGKKMGRKVVFLGRSLSKYVYAAEDIGLVDFSKNVDIVSYKSQAKKKLKEIEKKGRDKYLIVATGHQGEPNAVLSRIADQKLGIKLRQGDHIIFSCTVIPSPVNYANRELLERKLKNLRVRIFRDIHQSGHGSREDHRDMINMLKPENIIPGHADIDKTSALAGLAKELGYELGRSVHLMHDGQRHSFK
ncbi:RNase J family beta-CASP ribonuclease [Candidatus Woesearchaeota archaeon]|nr:RNase J family beta-CASP ribonuclease [Candidatus Woesearchaeota archaeon]